MRLLIVSDAWLPQVNGVVTSLLALQRELELLGHQVRLSLIHISEPTRP